MNSATNKEGSTWSALKDEVNRRIFIKVPTTINKLYCMYHNFHLFILLHTSIKYIDMAGAETSEVLITDVKLD